MAVAHKQREIVELLLKSGYDSNMVAQCHCKGGCITSGNIAFSSVLPRLILIFCLFLKNFLKFTFILIY